MLLAVWPRFLGESVDVLAREFLATLLAVGLGDEAALAEALDHADVGTRPLGHVAYVLLRDGEPYVPLDGVLVHALAEGGDEPQLELGVWYLD